MIRRLPHLRVLSGISVSTYRSPNRGGRSQTFPRNRSQHAQKLLTDFNTALLMYQQLKAAEPEVTGFYLEFTAVGSQPPLESLEHASQNPAQRIELLNVREPEDDPSGQWTATVFVPDTQANYHLRKVEEYANAQTSKDNPKHAPLVTHIEGVRLGSVRSLFADDLNDLPAEGRAWWEVWIKPEGLERLLGLTQRLELERSADQLEFPEHQILLVNSTLSQMERLVRMSGQIMELHLTSRFPSEVLDQPATDEYIDLETLLERVSLESSLPEVEVCLLDTGLNYGHPLLAPFVPASSCLSANAAWGSSDVQGHGTGMAGLALYGDLYPHLLGRIPVMLKHHLSSVKILPDTTSNPPRLYGQVTRDAVSIAEIEHPYRKHVYCLAVTDIRQTKGSNGRPTSWSGTLDQLAWEDKPNQRLFVVSAGNIRGSLSLSQYLDLNDLHWVESPAQAFNVLTVGAYTEKVEFSPPYRHLYTAIGHKFDLSPVSRTSVGWKQRWPLKPDVTLEGGNHAERGGRSYAHEDLRLITTANDMRLREFGDTSAASALAARMCAQIWAEHPAYWPETVRGLMVHSAHWTDAMKQHLTTSALPPKRAATLLLRRYGHGVPSFERALFSAPNDFTLLVEQTLQPFKKREDHKVVLNEMHFITLPWPREVLERMEDTALQLRVTLSYYVEPNLGSRGVVTSKHNYISHGLSFDIRRPAETEGEFKRRINAQLRDEEGDAETTAQGDNWTLGPISRRGTIQSDLWTQDTPAAMARRTEIAVYPSGGWWKLKPRLERFDQIVRYSLLVSLSAPDTEIDLYSAVVKVMNPVITPTAITV